MSKHRARKEMAVHIVEKNHNGSDLAFWQTKTPQERINAVEFLRSQYYSLSGYTEIPRITYTIQFRTNRT